MFDLCDCLASSAGQRTRSCDGLAEQLGRGEYLVHQAHPLRLARGEERALERDASAITRRSHWSASTHPPAIAWPFTAATTGNGNANTRRMVFSNRAMNALSFWRGSLSNEGNASPALK